MSDVVASVTAVLSQTSLQAGLQDAVPAVLQRHMQQMAAEARQQLLPGPDGGGAGFCAPSAQVGRGRRRGAAWGKPLRGLEGATKGLYGGCARGALRSGWQQCAQETSGAPGA